MATRVTDPGKHHGRPSANKGKTYPVEILTPDEVRGLAAQCSVTSSRGIRHRALIVLLYRTGLRISEALALTVGDVELDGGSIVVWPGVGVTLHRLACRAGIAKRVHTFGFRDGCPSEGRIEKCSTCASISCSMKQIDI